MKCCAITSAQNARTSKEVGDIITITHGPGIRSPDCWSVKWPFDLTSACHVLGRKPLTLPFMSFIMKTFCRLMTPHQVEKLPFPEIVNSGIDQPFGEFYSQIPHQILAFCRASRPNQWCLLACRRRTMSILFISLLYFEHSNAGERSVNKTVTYRWFWPMFVNRLADHITAKRIVHTITGPANQIKPIHFIRINYVATNSPFGYLLCCRWTLADF